MLDELKEQQRVLRRQVNEAREKAVEKALNGFMKVITDERTPKEVRETFVEAYKNNILNIFAD